MTGRFQRGGRGGGRGRGRSDRRTDNRSRSSSKKTTSSIKTKKTLQDHIFYVGSAKTASDYVTNVNYILNYIEKNYGAGGYEISQALEKMEEHIFIEPVRKYSNEKDADKKQVEDQTYLAMFEIEYKEFMQNKKDYKVASEKAYALLWSQCAKSMQHKILSRTDYDTDVKDKPIKLLAAIKEHSLAYESTVYRCKAIHDALKGIINHRMKDDESAIDYLKRFKVARDVVKTHCGKDFYIPKMVLEDQKYIDIEADLDSNNPTKRQKAQDVLKELKKETMEEFITYLYLENLDRSRYDSLIKGLESQFSLGNDQYPKDLVKAHNVVSLHAWDPEYKQKQKKKKEQGQRKNDQSKSGSNDAPENGLTFAQIKNFKNVCYCCGKDHKLPDCPVKATTAKDKWHINKYTGDRTSPQFLGIVKKINMVMAHIGAGSGDSVAPPSSVTGDQSNAGPADFWQLFNFASTGGSLRDKIILDSGSSADLFCDRRMIYDIKKSNKSLTLGTNAGGLTCDQEGTLPGYGQVPFYEDAVTNLMSLAKLADKYRVTYDNAVDDAFYAHTPHKVVRFGRNELGLYEHTPSFMNKERQTKPKQQMTMLQTVAENMKFYTPREVERAKRARSLLSALGSPSVHDLKTAIAMNAIANLPIKTEDVDIAEKIFGPDLGILKGKTTRRKPVPVVSDQISIPKELYTTRDAVDLCIDIMYVNEHPYMTTISRALYYRTALPLPSRTSDSLYRALDQVLRMYNGNNFQIKRLICDGEFKPIFDPVKDEMDVTMKYTAPNEHVSEAERNNRTIQERVRATYHRLPYAAIPTTMMKILVAESARKLNYFPNKHGISQHYSPRQILLQLTLDYDAHCKYAFGQYVQAHTQPNPTNTQEPRTLDCIYMRPTESGHEVYDLHTQRIITRRTLTALPITPSVIAAVEAIATTDKQKGLRLKTRKGITIYDSSWTAGVDYDESELTQNDEDDEDSTYEYESEEEEEMLEEDYESEDESDDDDSEPNQDDPENQPEQILLGDNESAGVAQDAEELQDEDEEQDDPVQEEQPEDDQDDQGNKGSEKGRPTRSRATVQRFNPQMKGQSHDQVHLQINESEATEYETDVAQYAVNLLMQMRDCTNTSKPWTRSSTWKNFLITYSLKKGIEKFKERGYESARKEMQQLHDRSCWYPIHLKDLSNAERKKALESLIFLVEKKSGTIKARHCANGSKQRQWMDQDEVTSPTVMTESVMLTATIEAEEKRDIATWDIPNAFIQTEVSPTDDQGDRIVMKIRGAMVDMLLEIDYDLYAPYVTMEKGQNVLYVHITRAIYGMLMSGLLFYKKFRKSIEAKGYKVNPYDPCVANKTINGKQHTITWHVDDVKGSHVDPKVNDEFGKFLTKEYGQEREVTGTRGKKHVYLGMLLDYSTPGEVKIDMTDYIEDMIEDYPTELKGKAMSAANDNLHKVEDGKKLDEMKAEAFHTYVAKALFLTKRARPDVQLPVSFLCTRVQNPTTYDWTKLTRMMDFLKRTKDEVLTLRSDGTRTATWSIDAAFAVHPDMKSHSGITMTLGKGAVMSFSRKQKLNTRSSTEAELVAVDDGMGPLLWTMNFLREQDYAVKSVILQDNESSIKLERNGRKSAGQRSRHIDIRYFFVTDQIEKGNVEIKYCPTDDMEADYMTKPLQGTKNRKFRKSIMNL